VLCSALHRSGSEDPKRALLDALRPGVTDEEENLRASAATALNLRAHTP
jgi:hypothetical protein